jgi:hypothetical protein
MSSRRFNAKRERCRATVAAALPTRAGERIVPFYCWDFAWCDCQPTTRFNQVPCIPTGVIGSLDSRHNPGLVRCLSCGVRWLAPRRRRLDRTPIGAAR